MQFPLPTSTYIGDWAKERLGNLPKVMQLLNQTVRLWTHNYLITKMVLAANTAFHLPHNDHLSFEEFPQPPLSMVPNTASDTENFPGKYVQNVTVLPEPSPGHKMEEKGRGAVSTEKLNLSGSHGTPPPLTHLRRGSRCCLDLNPRKIFKQDDLVILKPFQTTLKEEPRPGHERGG